MPTATELKQKFWKSLRHDMTMMIGLDGTRYAHARPMTAQFDGDRNGPIYFFTSTESELVKDIGRGKAATGSFSSKGHDLFATLHGKLSRDRDQATIDRLWNRFVAAWFEGGRDDPKLVLLRFDVDNAEIWLDGSSMVAGIKMLLGIDPKQDYKDHVATVKM